MSFVYLPMQAEQPLPSCLSKDLQILMGKFLWRKTCAEFKRISTFCAAIWPPNSELVIEVSNKKRRYIVLKVVCIFAERTHTEKGLKPLWECWIRICGNANQITPWNNFKQIKYLFEALHEILFGNREIGIGLYLP